MQDAIREMESLLGKTRFVTDPVQLREAEQATFATHQRVLAIIFAHSTLEVAACLQLAARFGVPIYPISGGKNWGNGSRVPTQDGSILLDLSRMKRIVEYNEALAYVSVEPGVTQGELQAFLVNQNSALTLCPNGASADASVVGNVLERGDGNSIYGERSQYAVALEAVLSTGEVAHTGFAPYQGAKCARFARSGPGPGLESLLLQSNYAVVTQMTLWLEPKPPIEPRLVLSVDDDDTMARVIDVLRVLQLQRIVDSISIWNDIKLFSRVTRYPFEAAKNRTPLPETAHLDLRRKTKAKRWTTGVTLSAWSRPHANALKRILKERLAHLVDDLHFVTPSGSSENLALAYWRKKSLPKNPHPDRDQCGLLWCMPLLPFAGEDAMSCTLLIEKICLAHKLEPNIAFLGTDARTLRLIVGLVYDRELPGQDENAQACHDQILIQLSARGYLPYRLGLQSMRAIPKSDDATDAVRARLHAAFDPARIIAPGRYEPY